MSSMTRLARLDTREDVLAVCGSWSVPHVHKTLALLVVCHTLHRLVLGMDGAATLPLVAALAAHLLLSLSALVFTVPIRTKLPHVLDGLYRAQVLAFTARSVGVMLLVLLEPPPEPPCRLHTYLLLCRLAVVAASHRAADAAQRALSDTAGPDAAVSTGVRRALRNADHAEAGSLQSRLVAPGRLFFSVAQLNATSQLLYVRQREYVLLGAFWTMAVIQFTAFLMTLRKKGLLPPDAWKWLYFVMLASVGVSMTRAVSGSELARISAVSLAFAAARLYAGVPKYVAMAAVTALAVCEGAGGF